MKTKQTGRRDFLKSSMTAAGLAWGARAASAGATEESQEPAAQPAKAPRIKFAAIGLNHGHINGQCNSVIRGGGELVAFFAKEDDLAAGFSKRFPQAKRARS